MSDEKWSDSQKKAYERLKILTITNSEWNVETHDLTVYYQMPTIPNPKPNHIPTKWKTVISWSGSIITTQI